MPNNLFHLGKSIIPLVFCSIAPSQIYTIQTVAGNGWPVTGPAVLNRLSAPQSVVSDAAGNFYVSVSNMVVRVDLSGNLTRIAGNGTQGFSGDGGPAAQALLFGPGDLALDAAGNLYIYDGLNYRVRKVDARTGFIQTIIGNSTPSLSAPSVASAPAATFPLPSDGHITVTPAGDVYLSTQCLLFRLASSSQTLVHVAGTTSCESGPNNGDNGPALTAQFSRPGQMALDSNDNLFILDPPVVRRIDAQTGIITTVAGGGPIPPSASSLSATSALLPFIAGITVDKAGRIFLSDSENNCIYLVDSGGSITTWIGTGVLGFSGDGGPAALAQVNSPTEMGIDAAGDIFFVDFRNARVRRVDGVTSVITTVAGDGLSSYSGDDGPASGAQLSPSGMTLDSAGNLYIADAVNNRVRKIDAATDVITTIAGNGTAGFGGDGGPATEAMLNMPAAVAVDNRGALYIADLNNSRLRRVDLNTGLISTFAGGGTQNLATGSALSISFGPISDVITDPAGNVYFAAPAVGRIYEIPAGSQTAWFIAGQFGQTTCPATATTAGLHYPVSIALDAGGNLFIAEQYGNKIDRVNLTTGALTTIAGYVSPPSMCRDASPASSGDGGPAAMALVDAPAGIAVDLNGDVFIAESAGGGRIREIDVATQTIRTIAGGGMNTIVSGEHATQVRLASPQRIEVTPSGVVYFADEGLLGIEMLSPMTENVPVITNVGNAAVFGSPFAPGSWVAISGLNLSASTRSWGPGDFAGNSLPTSLDGVSVTIDGIPAPVSYVSPGQINALCPEPLTHVLPGLIAVKVTVAGLSSEAYLSLAAPMAPELFGIYQNGYKYAAAVHADGSLVAPVGYFGSVASRPALPGETIEIFGTGFGPSNPPMPGSLLVATPQPLVTLGRALVGGQLAPVLYSGIVESGLDQFNVTIPSGLNGDVPISISAGTQAPFSPQVLSINIAAP